MGERTSSGGSRLRLWTSRYLNKRAVGWWFVALGNLNLATPELLNQQNAQTAHSVGAAVSVLVLGVGLLLSAQIDGMKQ